MTGVRHVWLRPEHSPTELPGLVLEWRRDAEGEWEALVTAVEPRGRVITAWVPAAQLRAVDQPVTKTTERRPDH